MKNAYHKESNMNGNLVLDLAREENMCIANMKFRKNSSRLWTFKSDANGKRSQSTLFSSARNGAIVSRMLMLLTRSKA